MDGTTRVNYAATGSFDVPSAVGRRCRHQVDVGTNMWQLIGGIV
jgi:hypothetical protein